MGNVYPCVSVYRGGRRAFESDWRQTVSHMIVQCSTCQKKMRVDQGRIPPGEKVKLRCPHCGTVQPYDENSGITTEDKPIVRSEPERDTIYAQPADDLTIPSDAFHEFRFPSERRNEKSSAKQTSSKSSGRWTSPAFWIAASLGIIILFALIVNIILPGPASQQPGSGLPQWEDNAPRDVQPARPK